MVPCKGTCGVDTLIHKPRVTIPPAGLFERICDDYCGQSLRMYRGTRPGDIRSNKRSCRGYPGDIRLQLKKEKILRTRECWSLLVAS